MQAWTAQRIKQLRQERNESQAVFAQHFGVDQSAVSLWENSETTPRGPIVRILDTLASERVS